MDLVFIKLFNMSIAAGWLILAVIVIRLFLKKAPKWIPCILWTFVAVRLLCPFSLESSFSLIPSEETISPQVVRYAQEPAIDSGISLLNNTLNPILGQSLAPAPGDSVNPLYIWTFLAGILWAAGLIVMLVYGLAVFFRIRKRIREAVPLRDHIRLCDAVKSPFIFGVFRPQIYLPSGIAADEMEYVLAHEETHLKRGDHWWKLAGFCMLTVYWFHPLVWAAYILFCRDIELACDEKVIKDMNLDGKKAYSRVLLDSSTHGRRMLVCPLAFGEVGIKERVKNILRYKKPACWIVAAAIAICAAVAVCFLTNPKKNVFLIKIAVPAGSQALIHYSEEEISPDGNTVTIASGEGLGDTEVCLKKVGTDEEYAGEKPEYLTPGMPVKFNAQKGAWYKIGVAVSNPSDEDRIVSVQVKGVQVRIADQDAGAVVKYDVIPMVRVDGKYYYDTGKGSDASGRDTEADGEITSTVPGDEIPQEDNQSNFGSGYIYRYVRDDTLEICINEKWIVFECRKIGSNMDDKIQEAARPDIEKAILEENASSHTGIHDFVCCDFVLLETAATEDTVTYYGWALYKEFGISERGIEDTGGSHMPVALTFELNEEGYSLQEYWQPGEGAYFVSDVRDKFPKQAAGDGIDSQKFAIRQMQSCYRQAVRYGGLDTGGIIDSLLETICSGPEALSPGNPQDYIEEHISEYHELLYYGEYTTDYCMNRFIGGKETGLEGKIMALVCEELLQTKGKLPVDAGTAETGQLWYDTLMAYAENEIKETID